jgi:hypothetical protein
MALPSNASHLSAYEKQLLQKWAFWRGIWYVGGLFMKASDSQITLQDRLEFISPLGIAGFVSWIFSLWNINAIPISFAVAVVFLVGNAFIHSFKRYESQKEKLEKIENEKIELKSEFIFENPPDIGLASFRLKLSNPSALRIRYST